MKSSFNITKSSRRARPGFAFAAAPAMLIGGAIAALATALAVAPPSATDPAPDASGQRPTKIRNVRNFADRAGHDEWFALRPVLDASGKPQKDQARVSKRPVDRTRTPHDTTPIDFKHSLHFNSGGVADRLKAMKEGKTQALSDTGRLVHIEFAKNADGKDIHAMACTYCHESDDAGRYMKSVRFDIHCADCHTHELGVVNAAEVKDEGKTTSELKLSKAGMTSALKELAIPPQAIPHGDPKEIAALVEKQIGQWALSSPPVIDAEKFKALKEAKPAEEEEKPKSGRGRRSAEPAAEAPKEEAPKTEDPPATSRRRGSTTEAAPAGPKPPPKIVDIFENAAGVLAWRDTVRDKAMAEIGKGCARCHTTLDVNDIKPGFEISPQKIPEVWLPRSVFSHSSHIMVACTECHELAHVPAPKGDDEKAAAFYEWANETARVMLPGIDSCRQCHTPEIETGSTGAPSDCVLCHTYHAKIPSSVQGRQTIKDMLHGGRAAVVPAKQEGGKTTPSATPGPKSEAKPEEKPAAGH
ncbi:MAG: cytochrome c3 family protein [Phycisphaerales bacterium]